MSITQRLFFKSDILKFILKLFITISDPPFVQKRLLASLMAKCVPDVQCRELGRETAIDYFVGLFYFRVQGRLACSILSSKFTNLQCNYWLLLVSWEAS